jgi:cardiolipin synthase
MALLAGVIALRGLPTLEVTYLGKAATFNLLYAFPFLLLALNPRWYGETAFIFGWAFTGWGVALYIATAIGYFRTGIKSIRVQPPKV